VLTCLQSATPPLDFRSQPDETFIMLVDRGPAAPAAACKFAEKVGAGQRGRQAGRLGSWVGGCEVFAGSVPVA